MVPGFLRRPTTYAIAFFGFICWIIYLADTGQDSVFFDFIKALPYGDKLGHCGLYGMLALLANFACGFRFLKTPRIQIGSLVVLTFALGEELAQHFNARRTMDIWDAIGDLVGIGIATAISVWLKPKLRKNTTAQRAGTQLKSPS